MGDSELIKKVDEILLREGIPYGLRELHGTPALCEKRYVSVLLPLLAEPWSPYVMYLLYGAIKQCEPTEAEKQKARKLVREYRVRSGEGEWIHEMEEIEAILRKAGITVELEDLQNQAFCEKSYIRTFLSLIEGAWSSYAMHLLSRALVQCRPNRTERQRASRLLVDYFKRNLAKSDEHMESIALNALAEMADASLLEEVGAMATDKRYGDVRPALCYVLAKMKDRRAVRYLLLAYEDPSLSRKDPSNRVFVLRCLVDMKAPEALPLLADAVQQPGPYQRDIRKLYEQLKRKLEGFTAKTSSAHRISRAIPKSVPWTSLNIDLQNLRKALQAISRGIRAGFAEAEIREVEGVAMDMEDGQKARFAFEINFSDKHETLWIGLECDDVDSFILTLAGPSKLIESLEGPLMRIAEDG